MIAQLLLILFYVGNTRAMIRQNSSSNGICYLNTLSAELLNYIASFLMESEEEFIARTCIQKAMREAIPIPKDCCEFLVNYDCHSALYALCPNETKALLLVRKRELCNNGRSKMDIDHVMIIDRQKNNNNYKLNNNYDFIYTRGSGDFGEHICTALSPGGNMIALFSEMRMHYGENVCRKSFLEIRKIYLTKNGAPSSITLAKQQELLLLRLEPTWIGFNKQGTHLIAHGKDPITKEARCHIFSLKMIDANQSRVITTNMQEYLRDKFVCKSIC
jgi:hypothetical protein